MKSSIPITSISTPMNRRQLLERIVQGFAATGVLFTLYPFVKSFMPAFGEDLTLEVSIADLGPGESKLVNWLGRKVLVVK